MPRFAASLFLLATLAAAPTFSIRATVDRTVVTVGDPITLSIVIRFDPTLKVRKPGPGAGLGDFEIKDYVFQPPRLEGKVAVDRADYTLAVYETGSFLVPAMRASALIDGREVEILTEPIKIEVRSLAAGRSNLEPSPDRALEVPAGRVPLRYFLYLASPLFAIGLFFAGRAFWRWWRRRRIPPLLPHERAQRDLNELLAKSFPEGERDRFFYYRLSEILRAFIEATVPELPLTILTTRQSLELLSTHAAPFAPFLAEFLPYSDRIKFARLPAQPADTARFVAELRGLIAAEAARVEAARELKKA
ncbi:MAG: hypothetical protein J0L75_09050 [Spirochaetes bacterium]|nr:hypothetical protein [Spirochaetota bacterium]